MLPWFDLFPKYSTSFNLADVRTTFRYTEVTGLNQSIEMRIYISSSTNDTVIHNKIFAARRFQLFREKKRFHN